MATLDKEATDDFTLTEGALDRELTTSDAFQLIDATSGQLGRGSKAASDLFRLIEGQRVAKGIVEDEYPLRVYLAEPIHTDVLIHDPNTDVDDDAPESGVETIP